MLSINSEFIKIMLLNSFFIDKIFDLGIANLCGDGSLGISLSVIGESVLIRSWQNQKITGFLESADMGCRGQENPGLQAGDELAHPSHSLHAD